MKRLYLMRHGEAELIDGQEEGNLFSTGDTPLSEKGRAQATTMAKLLADEGIDAVLTSPLQRAKETAEIIADALGLKVVEDIGLRELPFAPPGSDYGIVLGRIRQLAVDLRRNTDPTLIDGKRISMVKARFQSTIAKALDYHERPLVVAHGAMNRLYLAELLGMPAHALFRLEQDHGCVNVVVFGDRHPVVLKMNATAEAMESAVSSLAGSG